MSLTSNAANVSLTVSLLPTQSVVPNETYLYDDALYDARGYGYSDYSGSPRPRNNTLYLWESGCRTDDTWNCTLACSDSDRGRDMVWNSTEAMFTLQNCLVYPILATAAEYDWLVQEPSDLLEKFDISPKNRLLSESGLDSEDEASAWPTINGCLQRACAPLYDYQAGDVCSRFDTRTTEYSAGPSDAMWNVTLTFHGSSRLCALGTAAPNSDIGGPGVMLSIMQQVVILMVIWLILSLFQWLRAALGICFPRAYGTRLDQTSQSSFFARQKAALIITLYEFQKTQVFLLLAMQVVILLALEHATWLEAPTPLQLLMNAVFMMLLSTAGVYPIILGLLTLRKAKGHSEWFTLVASVACVTTSSVSWARVGRIDLTVIQQQSDVSLDECGHSNPMRFCLPPGTNIRSETGVESMPVLRQRLSIGPICVVLYLVLEKTLSSLLRRNMIRTPSWAEKTARKTQRHLSCFTTRTKRALQVFLFLCAEAWLLWGNIMIFTLFYEVWEELKDEGMVWTFGQVIGVGVWIPVFLEWLYAALRGIEVSSRVRLPDDYKVVKLNAKEADSGSSDSVPLNHARSVDQQSNIMLSAYEPLPNPLDDYRHAAHMPP